MLGEFEVSDVDDSLSRAGIISYKQPTILIIINVCNYRERSIAANNDGARLLDQQIWLPLQSLRSSPNSNPMIEEGDITIKFVVCKGIPNS